MSENFNNGAHGKYSIYILLISQLVSERTDDSVDSIWWTSDGFELNLLDILAVVLRTHIQSATMQRQLKTNGSAAISHETITV